MKKLIITAIVAALSTPVAFADIKSFSSAKRALYSKVPDTTTFYAQCKMWPGYIPRPNLSSCELTGEFEGSRLKSALKIEATRVVPVHRGFKVNGSVRSCFTEAQNKSTDKEKYCLKHDESFKKAYRDLVNLYPAVQQIHKDRAGKPFGKVNKIIYTYGSSQSLNGEHYFQPQPELIGDIARVAFHMNYAYGIDFSEEEIEMYLIWNEMDPVSEEEIIRNRAIKKIQGWSNAYVPLD